MLTTAVYQHVPTSTFHSQACICWWLILFSLEKILSGCTHTYTHSYTWETHLQSMSFSASDFCLFCFLWKAFPHGCQLLSVSDDFLLASLSIPTSHPLRMCVPECPPGFFRDDKRRCKKCSPLCESCVGSRSDQCTSCRQGFYLREGANTCVYACPEGYYLDRGKLPFPFHFLV